MNYCYGKGVQRCVLCWEVFPFSGESFIGGPLSHLSAQIAFPFGRNDDNLKRVAVEQFIDRPHMYGRDPLHGGLLYFVDRGGHDPVQLEWSMKLWWVHCEGMLASLVAYRDTRERRHWEIFALMAQLCLSKVRVRICVCEQACVCVCVCVFVCSEKELVC